MTKRRENEFKKSSSNLKHNPLVVLPHLPLLLTVPIMWPLDQAMNLSSHFTLKPWSSSTNSCNEEGVRYFIFLYYSLAERTSSSETKSEYLRHYEELKGWEKKKNTKTTLAQVLLGCTASIVPHCPDHQGNVQPAFLNLNVFCLALIKADKVSSYQKEHYSILQRLAYFCLFW